MFLERCVGPEILDLPPGAEVAEIADRARRGE
jgi:hypothetical protein